MKACPFCGSYRICKIFCSDLQADAIACEDCFARGPVQRNAEIEWNTRAESRWIPVEERLPEVDAWVLTAWRNGLFAVERRFGEKWSTGAFITHWMPLPEPPSR